ncbi:MAG: VWA domain-containing protein [Paracoccaceae bacterium]
MPRRFLSLLACLCLLPGLAQAQQQERPRTILVLDGSGSMWGQIEGTAKITIAQEAVNALLDTLPETQELGLTAYGHRREGDCGDIETLVAPGAGTRAAIAKAVGEITPRGRTPLSDAVLAAAEALRYEDVPATVILVSDGRETCDADPCAVGRALEAAGVDFTAHVIGFDIEDDAEAGAQLQCLAEETGGRFLTAANAAELGEALADVAEEAAPVTVTFRALAGEDGPPIEAPLIWNAGDGETRVIDFQRGASVTADFAPGDYTARVLRPEDEASAEADFTAEGTEMTVTLTLPAPLPEARLEAADTVPAGATIPVTWEGPDGARDYVAVARPDESGYVNYTYTDEGSPLDLQIPAEPGRYELRYFDNERDRVLATRPIEATPVEATLDAPDSAPAGAVIETGWTGPDYDRDYLSVSRPDESGYVNYVYTREGDPAPLRLPPEPGTYEIRYVMQQDDTVIARHEIEVTPVEATLDIPETAMAGETLPVGWTGPDYDRDYLSVATPDESGYVNYVYTREGSPGPLRMPAEPGDYVIRYVMQQDDIVLAEQPITVQPLEASLDAPAQAAAGETLQVGWDGPDYERDYIAIARPEDDGYESYTYTREGSPLGIGVPLEPGRYELRYVMQQDDKVLAARTLEVVDIEARISAPDQARAGAHVVVRWEGPGYDRDYVSVARPDQPPNRYVNFTYTREGTPLLLHLPSEPGEYEIRYVAQASGSSDTVLARAPISAREVDATIRAEDSAPAGGVLALDWEGPDFKGDYIALVKQGEERARETIRTTEDSPMVMRLPEGPGAYELRYVIGQGDRVIATRPLELTYTPE